MRALSKQRYKAVPFRIIHRSTNQLIVEMNDGDRSWIAPAVCELLTHWTNYRTSDQMIRQYAAFLAGRSLHARAKCFSRRLANCLVAAHESMDELRRPHFGLESVARSLVLQAIDLKMVQCEGAESGRNTAPPGTAMTIAIPTCDRPKQLEATMQAAQMAAGNRGQEANYIVADGSRFTASAEANLVVLRTFFENTRANILYAGQEYRRELISMVGSSTGCHEALAFALDVSEGDSFGANRNTLLLGALGSVVLNVDDDVLLTDRTTAKRHAVYCADSEPARLAILGASSTMSLPRSRSDFLQDHFALLGSAVSDVTSEFWSRMSSPCKHLVQENSSQRARIGYTVSGASGDCGMRSIAPIVTSRDSMIKLDPETYFSLKTQRSVRRFFDGTYIGHSGHHVGMCFGQDCRAETVPYFPFGRNEDGLMATLSKICLPHIFWAYVPTQVLHVPHRDSLWREEWQKSYNTIEISEVLIALVNSFNPCERWDQCAILSHIGSRFIEMGYLRSPELQSTMRGVVDNILLNRLSAAQQALIRTGRENKLLAEDLREAMRLVRTTLSMPFDFSLIDGCERCLSDERERRFRKWLINYGTLLRQWPKIAEAASSPYFKSISDNYKIH